MDPKLMMLQFRKDNWSIVDELDNWIFIFDGMPRQMKLIIDLKISGLTNRAISRRTKLPENQIRSQVSRAKKRLLRGERIL